MAKLCTFPAGEVEGSQCPACGYRLTRDYPGGYARLCRPPATTRARPHHPEPATPPPPSPGLGDHTERLLHSLGVTPDRYQAAKERFGLAPTCNCASRKEWLNRVGKWLGI